MISDRPDYSSIYVSDGCDIVEKAGGPPWRTLFKAVLELKIRQLKRKLHAKATERKESHQVLASGGFTARRYNLSAAGRLVILPSPISSLHSERSENDQSLPVRGQCLDQLRGAKLPKTNQECATESNITVAGRPSLQIITKPSQPK
jgi:hypothetical protein